MDDNISKTIVFYCCNFSMGGTETLILRLLQYYSTSNHRAILLTDTSINQSILDDANRVDFEHYIYNKGSKEFLSNNKKLCFGPTEKPLVITQFLPEFLKSFTLLRKSNYGVRFKHTLYIVHPNSIFFGPKKLIFLAKPMIVRLLKKNVLVFMDETCVEKCIQHYSLNKSLNYMIYRLPIFINENGSVAKKHKIFSILTISRFEFPFKGYVLGLITSFSQLCTKYPLISLTIIGNGKGKAEVEDLISKLPDSVSSKIEVLNQIPYHKVNDYIVGCDVYVGMGTTVLDAANNNKIVVTAVAYQKSNLAVGFFHEEYKTIGEVFRNDVAYPIFDNLLEEVINTNEDDFISLSKKSKKILEEHYNINSVGENLLKHTKDYLSVSEISLIKTLAYIHLYSVRIVEKIRG